MMSVLKTIEVIDFCCDRKAYSDGYTLIRKFRDDLMQYLFILHVIQNKHGLSDKEFEEYPLEPEFILEVINKNIEILINGERKSKAELAMEKWIYDELDKLENIKDRKEFFGTSKYKSYLIIKKWSIYLNIFLRINGK